MVRKQISIAAVMLIGIALAGAIALRSRPVEGQPVPAAPIRTAVAERLTFTNVSELASVRNASDKQIAEVSGFYSQNDGGGGTFHYDAANSDVHDGGMVLAPGAPDPAGGLAAFLNFKSASKTGRWLRIAEPGRINLKWYGARGDGLQDDSPAAARAPVYFYAHKSRGTLFIPRGTYYIADKFPLYPHVDVVGDGIGQTILQRRNDENYLICGGPSGSMEMSVSQLSFENTHRLLLYRNMSNIAFHDVEFLGGMVRFEDSQYIQIDRCLFRNNVGKAAYASNHCSYVTITNNVIRNTSYGGLNLSHHAYCVVSNNVIVKDAIVPNVPGYGGIRLPNTAQFNTVSGNIVRNCPRGIFVLSGSSYNTIVGNVVDGAALQGMLIESDRNTIAQNVIVNPGAECIRLNGANACVVSGNQLSTTQPTIPALSVTSQAENNQLLNNLIDAAVPVMITASNASKTTSTGNLKVNLPRLPTTQPATAE